MADSWSNETSARVSVKDASTPGVSYSFEGMNSNNSAFAYSLVPSNFLRAINMTLSIVGKEAQFSGITRTVKQEGVSDG